MTNDSSYRSDSLMFIAGAIATRGLAVMSIGSSRCSVPGCVCEPEAVQWSYTIGLCEREHPEVVTLGLPPVHAVELLNWVHDRDVAGQRLRAGQAVRFQGVAVQPVPVPAAWVGSDDNPMGNWFAHYGIGRVDLQPPVVWQLLWADEHGRLPGHARCSARSTSSSRSSGTTQRGELVHRTLTSVDDSASCADERGDTIRRA